MKRVTERQKGMPRLNAVVNHEVYQTYYKRICECETDRVFCCHQMNHLLDVARIAYIKNLEEGLGFDKELIYVAAVLHDIGKYSKGFQNYIRSREEKEPHAKWGGLYSSNE